MILDDLFPMVDSDTDIPSKHTEGQAVRNGIHKLIALGGANLLRVGTQLLQSHLLHKLQLHLHRALTMHRNEAAALFRFQ